MHDIQRISDIFLRPLIRSTSWNSSSASATTSMMQTENAAAWFESAVDRCAFLAWNMSLRGSRVRFCTQDVDWQLPEEADVYTILKYLAVVSRRPGKPLAASNDRDVFQIIFSALPERLAEAGWELGSSNVRLFVPDTTAPAVSSNSAG